MAASAAAAAFFFFALGLHAELADGCYTSIFSFGASVVDTGNSLILTGNSSLASRLPYGQTFFHRPTGRFSDGRLIIDFIAQAMGLPLVKPYLGGGGAEDFRHGANFAVAGATALDVDYFQSRGINNLFSNNSLSVQLRWFEQLLPSLCSSASDCDAFLSNALFSVGQIGANDYNNPFFQNRSAGEIATFVPDVVSAIGSAIDPSVVQKLIGLGVRTMVVPGSFPMGCFAAYLNKFQEEKQESYDPRTGCLNWLNDFAILHNRLLLAELQRLRRQHPEVAIMYADVYHASMAIYASPRDYGFKETVLAACCGFDGGDYKFSETVQCGGEGSSVCSDPSRQICWDGIHTTEAANRIIAGGLLGSYTVPPISDACPDLNWDVVGFHDGDGHTAPA
ncbi:sinapine esterase-like [Zingiber officinale]|uniref:sinapine esterase-like n=1 Tax=Zingiber officinale TaxID=94328 RepID=UPI001C4C4022|nr:sinapine esterase-like [Zingiber officinale]